MHEDVMTILDMVPEGYREYKRRNGCHFTEALCEFAVDRMKKEDGERIKAMSPQEVDTLLKEFKVELKNKKGFDHVFVANMGLADYLGESVPDMEHLARYVKDVIDDPDGYEGIAFCRWLADVAAMKVEVPWEEVL